MAYCITTAKEEKILKGRYCLYGFILDADVRLQGDKKKIVAFDHDLGNLVLMIWAKHPRNVRIQWPVDHAVAEGAQSTPSF